MSYGQLTMQKYLDKNRETFREYKYTTKFLSSTDETDGPFNVQEYVFLWRNHFNVDYAFKCYVRTYEYCRKVFH